MINEMLPEIREVVQCPKCEIHMDGHIVRKVDGLCPRCCYEIDDTIDVPGDDLVDVETEKGNKEFCDLMLMLNNWCDGYIRLITERGVDWSIPHEFLQEFGEQMIPYIARLRELGYVSQDRMLTIGDIVQDCLRKLIEAIEQEEGLMRLTGQWNEQEEEIKKYWEKKLGRSFELLGSAAMAQNARGIVQTK